MSCKGPKKKKKPLIVIYKDLLTLLSKLNKDKRKKFISLLKKREIDSISEIFNNFLNKRLTTDPRHINRLKPFSQQITAVARKKTATGLKKKILSSLKGGNILAVLLPLAVNLIGKLIG